MKETEIELQARIEHLAPLLVFLEKEARFELKTHQRDEYFIPQHRDFLVIRPVQEWLRIRDKFETSYAPEKKEIVYCEKCYQAEVV